MRHSVARICVRSLAVLAQMPIISAVTKTSFNLTKISKNLPWPRKPTGSLKTAPQRQTGFIFPISCHFNLSRGMNWPLIGKRLPIKRCLAGMSLSHGSLKASQTRKNRLRSLRIILNFIFTVRLIIRRTGYTCLKPDSSH